jgi:hypothetical protein
VVGGTAVPSDFTIYIKNASSSNVLGSPAFGTSTPASRIRFRRVRIR